MRLTRRGVTLPAAGLASLLAVGPADAKFVAAVSGSAVAYVSGSLVSSPVVLQLVHGAYRAMILAKLKVAATAGVIALGGAGLSVGGWAYTTAQVPGGEKKPAVKGLILVMPDGGLASPPPATPEEPRKITMAQVQRSLANLNKLQGGMIGFADKYDGTFPNNIVSDDKAMKFLLSWRVAILPYIGEEKLFKEFKLDQPWDSEHNMKLLGKMPACMRVGFEAKDSTHTYYQIFHAPGAAMFPTKMHETVGGDANGPGTTVIVTREPKITRITDGTSNTIGVAECGPPVPWTKPEDIAVADLSKPLPPLAWPFQEAILVGMMDGSSQAFSRKMTDPHLRAMITASNGEVIEEKLSKGVRLRLPATTAEEKAMLDKARVEMAVTAKAIQAAAAEYFRLIQEAANDDLFEIEEINRDLKRNLADHIAKNKELAAPKK